MKLKRTLIFVTLLIFSLIISCGVFLQQKIKFNIEFAFEPTNNLPTSIKMYNLIEGKSEEYNIPKHILYNIAWLETRYAGPFDWKYNPYITSRAGAEGAMQVMLISANSVSDRYISNEELKNDLELNIDISCKKLKKLYEMYGEWDKVLGCYNTGSPIINGYANYGSSNKDYISNWIRPN